MIGPDEFIRIEIAGGAVDGSNRDFTVSIPYVSGRLLVHRNGQLQIQGADNEYFETGEQTFRMVYAPDPEDIVQATFVPA